MNAAKCTLGVVAVFALGAVALATGETRKDLHFKVGKRPTISINNPYGPILVKAGGGHEVVVIAVLRSDKVEIDHSQSRNRIDIVSHLLSGGDQNSGVVEYQVAVPADASLNVHAENGAVHAEKLQGDISIEGNSGSIEVVDCAGGHVHVKTLNAPVTMSNVRSAHVEVVSMAGNVTLNSVSGPNVTVNSNTGKIEYAGDFSGEGEYDFTSHTGDIEAVAPAYASIDVTARSNQGRVDSDFSLEPKHTPFIAKAGSYFSGTLNKAASSVKLMSFSGKIHLKKRQ
jgi:hypothetical protein